MAKTSARIAWLGIATVTSVMVTVEAQSASPAPVPWRSAPAAQASDGVRVSLAAGVTGLTLLAQERHALHYRAELGELVGVEVSTPAGSFVRLVAPGIHSSKTLGSPELPMLNRLIEIPLGATAHVEILSAESVSVDLADYGLAHPLAPAQPSAVKSELIAAPAFVCNDAAYDREEISAPLVAIAPLGRLRAMDIGRLEVSPVAYFPRSNRVRVHTALEFRVEFRGGEAPRGEALRAKTYSPFFDAVYARVDGSRGLDDRESDFVGGLVTMAIVTPPEFESQARELAAWKTRRGFRTVVALTGSPRVGDSAEEIRSYIRTLWDGATRGQPAPTFVLFIGDVDRIPTWFVDDVATDRPYCAMDGDRVPDIYYGRLSVANSTDLSSILEKTYLYERGLTLRGEYQDEVVLVAGEDSFHGDLWGNGQINYGLAEYFNLEHGIHSQVYLCPGSGPRSKEIMDGVSAGVSVINYTGHGDWFSWVDPYISQDYVEGLQNYAKYCLVLSNACLTAAYDTQECFGESWLRKKDGGAIGFIGASSFSMWDEDYWWAVGTSETIELHPTYETTGRGAYDGVFHDHGEDMNQWYITHDAIIFCGNLSVMESGSPMWDYYWDIYNLLGDPSLSPNLGLPRSNPVHHPAYLLSGWDAVRVEAAPGSYVGLVQNGEVIGAGTTDTSGQVRVPIVWSRPAASAVRLTVTAQNHQLYTQRLPVVVQESPGPEIAGHAPRAAWGRGARQADTRSVAGK